MSQPKSNPIAVRVPADLKALIDSHVTETGINRNLAIVMLLRHGLDEHARRGGMKSYTVAPGPAPRRAASASEKADRSQTEAAAAQTALQEAEWKSVNAKIKPKAVEPHIGKDGIAVGQVAQKPGSRLKQAPRGRDKWTR